MAPFLRYLYCEPSQLRENAELRMGLLRILLQPRSPKHTESPSVLERRILQLLYDLIPHLQVELLPNLAFYEYYQGSDSTITAFQVCKYSTVFHFL